MAACLLQVIANTGGLHSIQDTYSSATQQCKQQVQRHARMHPPPPPVPTTPLFLLKPPQTTTPNNPQTPAGLTTPAQLSAYQYLLPAAMAIAAASL